MCHLFYSAVVFRFAWNVGCFICKRFGRLFDGGFVRRTPFCAFVDGPFLTNSFWGNKLTKMLICNKFAYLGNCQEQFFLF